MKFPKRRILEKKVMINKNKNGRNDEYKQNITFQRKVGIFESIRVNQGKRLNMDAKNKRNSILNYSMLTILFANSDTRPLRFFFPSHSATFAELVHLKPLEIFKMAKLA